MGRYPRNPPCSFRWAVPWTILINKCANTRLVPYVATHLIGHIPFRGQAAMTKRLTVSAHCWGPFSVAMASFGQVSDKKVGGPMRKTTCS